MQEVNRTLASKVEKRHKIAVLHITESCARPGMGRDLTATILLNLRGFSLSKVQDLRARELAQGLGALGAPPEDPRLVPCTDGPQQPVTLVQEI